MSVSPGHISATEVRCATQRGGVAARILIIEDNSTNLELVRYLLEHAGHATVAASDGSAGLAVLQTMRPDLILTDLRMPIADGLIHTQSLLSPGLQWQPS